MGRKLQVLLDDAELVSDSLEEAVELREGEDNLTVVTVNLQSLLIHP